MVVFDDQFVEVQFLLLWFVSFCWMLELDNDVYLCSFFCFCSFVYYYEGYVKLFSSFFCVSFVRMVLLYVFKKVQVLSVGSWRWKEQCYCSVILDIFDGFIFSFVQCFICDWVFIIVEMFQDLLLFIFGKEDLVKFYLVIYQNVLVKLGVCGDSYVVQGWLVFIVEYI